MTAPIQIGGVIPLTTIDFPGRLAAVVFCQGCPWRCRYCHNSHLQPFVSLVKHNAKKVMDWIGFLEFLKPRRNFLDGVVLSGGEPTYQKNLPEAMKQIREMGFEIGLHTAGPDPDRLEAVLPWVTWVGMDIKAPFDERYDAIVGIQGAASRAKKSLQRLLRSGVDYQLRTTVHPALLGTADLQAIARELKALGAKQTVLQPFRPQGCVDPFLLTHFNDVE